MEVRLALAALIVVLCGLCGRSLAWAASRRGRLLRETLNALKLLRIQIVNHLEPLERALGQSGSPLFESVARRLGGEGSAAEAWRQTIGEEGRRGKAADSLSKGDLQALERLFDHLGESGRADQNEAIRACIASLELARDEAAEYSARIGRLYTSMGILTGLAIAVLII